MTKAMCAFAPWTNFRVILYKFRIRLLPGLSICPFFLPPLQVNTQAPSLFPFLTLFPLALWLEAVLSCAFQCAQDQQHFIT